MELIETSVNPLMKVPDLVCGNGNLKIGIIKNKAQNFDKELKEPTYKNMKFKNNTLQTFKGNQLHFNHF